MSKTLIVVITAFLYSSPLWAAGMGSASDSLQYTPASYYVDGFDEAESNAWVGLYSEQFRTEEIKAEELRERKETPFRVGIGMEVAPLFGTYGVFRTNIKNDQSTYLAIGITADELYMDESDNLDGSTDGEFSYGFGVKNASYNIEYMMYMDEENSGVAAFSLGFISEF